MNILVTGGTGYIGENFIPELIKKGHRVRLLVRNLEKAKKMFGDSCEYFVSDIIDSVKLNGCCDNIDIVYHMVAKVGNELPSEKSFNDFRLINVIGTKNLIKEAKKSNVKKFVFVSSIAAMGIVKETPITEESICNPYLPYQVSKYEAEELVKKEYKKNNFPGICIRPTKVYGVGEHEFSFLTLARLCKKRIFIKIGKGCNYISNIYITDFVQGLINLLDKGKFGETYILTSKDSISFKNVGRTISNVIDKKILILLIPSKLMIFLSSIEEKVFIKFGKKPIVTKKNVEAVISDRVYDISKAMEDLDFNPQVSMDEGISKVVKWYINTKKL